MDSFRTLLVHVDGGHDAAARLQLARQLAARHEARLQVQFSVLPVPQELASGHLRRARADFDRLDAAGGWPMGWRPPTDEQPIPAFSRLALHADLLVLGQRDLRDVEASNVPVDFVESVLATCGRPALVVPHHPAGALQPPEVAVVAWRPTREAASALAGAMPLLRQTREVHLLVWMDDRDEASREAEAVEDALIAHGVPVPVAHLADEPADVGAALLAAADGLGAEVLVMGCYGHAPARELVLGGATRTVLREARVPVLMAH